MSNVIIAGTASGATALPVANTIDGSLDYIPIYTATATATQAITRNTYLNISSQPLGLTDTQSPTNKTFDNTNTITIKDGSLTLQNTSSTTKQARFSTAGITAGQTRTITLPDFNATMASLAGVETFTNKTLTSPTINSPTITNATITTDAITGFSSSTTGTIFGISVASSKISGTAISNTTIPKTALDNGASWAWTSYTPSPQGFSGTPTTTLARYTQIGKTVFLEISFTGTSNATTCTFTLPVAPLNACSFHPTVTDSGTVQTSSGYMTLAASSTTATLFKTLASGAFTASGTKAVTCFNVIYEVA